MNEITVHQPAKSAVVPMSDIVTMGKYIAQSGLFGIKNEAQAVALMLVAQAEGLHPATAARDYHVIQGRPSLKADAMLARFQAAGGSVKWVTLSDAKVEATFSHPAGGSATIDWTIDRANKAGLSTGAGGMFAKYPRQMLRSRVVSEGIRTVFPAISIGIYTPEEVGDMDAVKYGPDKVEPIVIDTSHIIPLAPAPAPEKVEAEIIGGDYNCPPGGRPAPAPEPTAASLPPLAPLAGAPVVEQPSGEITGTILSVDKREGKAPARKPYWAISIKPDSGEQFVANTPNEDSAWEARDMIGRPAVAIHVERNGKFLNFISVAPF